MAKALLGISPGTRIVGLAVIEEGELVKWKVKTFKAAWSSKKRKMILDAIDNICGNYNIHKIAIKKIDAQRSSPQLDRLIVAISKLSERNAIPIAEYSLSDLDYDKRSNARLTKGRLSEEVAARHPKLRYKLLRERGNRTEYYTKMFEAIAMAERCRDDE
ncbi:hypothetical protein CJD36_004390 [Flavipsychrobacter stenotrophus]|uniref:Holliday junction resolvase RuvC n=1 Tax=Flavipsychrobacter stenotrophus TaxID=2077091 RepID=A0A2S7T1A8_9BACT|nr:hypothetical protein [Flavipsychrobacter stenotrophus]PQJ12989.1 hypothetical protein CJD36_004390 [Flavipsychrobacter stenotrophus]